jgi:hypothetical protein
MASSQNAPVQDESTPVTGRRASWTRPRIDVLPRLSELVLTTGGGIPGGGGTGGGGSTVF